MQSLTTEGTRPRTITAKAIEALRMRARGIRPSTIMAYFGVDYATYRDWITGGTDDTDGEFRAIVSLTVEVRRIGITTVAAS